MVNISDEWFWIAELDMLDIMSFYVFIPILTSWLKNLDPLLTELNEFFLMAANPQIFTLAIREIIANIG